MRTSPLNMGFFYFVMGSLFTYLAIESAHGYIWKFSTVILMIVATLDFAVSLRMFALHFKIKKMNK
ncbi:MAG TPA: YdiK family protein [Metabacillus sp.]|nr:YdiK family protein [Metabacillus sp.]